MSAPTVDYGDPRLPERFWLKVYPCPITGCWLWGDRPSGKGYGQYWTGGRRPVAHRFLWESTVGPVPAGLELDHLCRVRCCVNPEHLEPVTGQVNVLRGISVAAAYARRTSCKHGHRFTAENTIRRPNGARGCRTCVQANDERRRPRKPPRTHCGRGHEFTEANTLTGTDGVRRCRTCARNRSRRSMQRLRSKEKTA